MGFRAGVDSEPGCSGFLDDFCVLVYWFNAIPSEANFDAHGDLFGDGIADGFGYFVDSLRAAEDGCSAIVAIDGGGGAAKVNVDGVCSGEDSVDSGGCHMVGIAAEDLDLDGESRDGCCIRCKFGYIADEYFFWEGMIADANEFGDGVCECALCALECAHGGICDAVHGGKYKCGLVEVDQS